MAARQQNTLRFLSKGKQSNIGTMVAVGSSAYLRFKSLNGDQTALGLAIEDDAPEYGKGTEFATATYPVAFTPQNRIDKYGTAEFLTWALAYGLGSVVESAGVYTLVPINPATLLELPYFTIIEQQPEGGSNSIDNAFIGCSIEEVMIELNYGAGRQSCKVTVSWAGSGKRTTPSGFNSGNSPAIQTESHLISATATAITILGTNYLTNKNILSCKIGWKNNLLLDAGFFPGSGTQNGAAIRGRIEVGSRVPSFEFTTRLVTGAAEEAAYIAGTTGSAGVTLTFDSTHNVAFSLPLLTYKSVTPTSVDGISAVTVVTQPMQHPSNGVFSVSAQCGITGIAQ